MAEPKEFLEDMRWGEEHYSELQKQYKDKWVAIVGKKVVSHGENLEEVENKAKKISGKKYVPVIFVESGAAIY
ncbi:MAG: DUF5678 domain-containing protein [Euryarchaeota archaeon]|nr:DUF5678 domain-containing protein [Euryarchaeota archaeon]